MGMYDYVRVNIDKLPITAEDAKIFGFGDTFDFQSKGWECRLGILIITDEGTLIYEYYESLFEDEERTKKILTDYHGYLNFYDYVNTQWFEFNAKFTDGKLVEIKRVQEHT